MQVKHSTEPADSLEAGALIVVVTEGGPFEGPGAGWLKELNESGEFTGKALDTALWHRPEGVKARRLMAVGAGKASEFSASVMRRAVAAAVRKLNGKGVRDVVVAVPGTASAGDFAAAAVEGALLGAFEPDQHKTEAGKDKRSIDVLTVAGGSADAVERGRILGEAQNFTRALVNEPPNILTPLVLAARAQEMAKETGLECEILDRGRMAQLGMGALLGVAQGSAEPPALIVLRYRPEGNPASGDHLGLVGKGVTFDTGGISIKPSDGMEKMKYDMAGGGAMLGAMRAISQLKPAIPVTALIPAVENMPGSRAQRPGDIVKSFSGKTVEVLNTDAEGRLILIDAITYAERLGCTHLVDAATLTGAIVVALGHLRVGAFTNNEAFLKKLFAASEIEGERMWHMPLDDDYLEALKSPFADLQNIGGRAGGSITASMFIRQFVDKAAWVHLDIAGTAWNDDSKPDMAKGPTGVCVRTLARLAISW
ncbi:MAG TPA: leucyl aminopeptidase [Bryobacteraceae bacterium]|jgi:leucyl aminopeptidase|nr:leucyl aminopeptidase [Bryobacteraceae bacterium]